MVRRVAWFGIAVAVFGIGAIRETRSAEPASRVADWPRFHGPNSDSICPETGLLAKWPKAGPPLAWKLEGLGKGYSTVSIAGGRLFTMGDLKLDGQEEAQFVMAFDLQSHKRLWAVRVGPPHEDGGPRCTPTVDEELVYCLGTDGDLVCVEAATGKVRWQKNLAKDFGGKMMSGWKYSESPLVDGPRLLCTPGGNDAIIVALDKQTGEPIWRAAMPELGPKGKDGAGYSSMVVAEIDGVRQYVQMVGRGVVAVEAESGKFLWSCNKIANSVANITAPIVRGNQVFCTTSYKTGSTLVEVRRRGNAFEAKEIYFLGPKEFENHHGGVILLGKHVYGGSGQNAGEPVCLELATGKIAWSEKAPARGSAAVLYADGHLYFRYDTGTVVLVQTTPKAFRVTGTFMPLTGEGPAWAHPVIHDGKLYLRHGDVLGCYDLRKK
jgi:outer membrane protein assembly factor BamB